ncbi:MAG: COX15/CtaA family protein [Methylobacillus sp.]|nr:COX15/CtaA family protein [Methylobacillus sp.]
MKTFDRLLLAAALLTFCVVVLGAYVRLSDAGLGCPDWPGCYGHLSVPQAEDALAHSPNAPLEAHKAWKEMVHRYFAGTLGLLLLALCVTAWRKRRAFHAPVALPTALLLVVGFQAALGMWTVTLLLKPAIVSAHLLGGMTTLALLTWLAHRRFGSFSSRFGERNNALKPWARLGLVILAIQIFLGGWTSSNYAALACADFPLCQGALLPPTDFTNAFHMIRELGQTADGAQIPFAALTAIHWTHRLGALVTLLYLGWLAARTMRAPGLGALGAIIAVLLLLQIGLGISNVMFSLPLPVAVAHNAVAALLLVSLVVLNSKTTERSGRQT